MNNFEEQLSRKRLKVTKARLAVLTILSRESRPLDVPEILFFLKRNGIPVDQATVYRMMDTLTDNAIIKRLEFNEGKFRYEINGKEHHHLICEQCGSIEDYPECTLDAIEQAIETRNQFLVRRHALEFYGLCKKCHA